MAAFTAWDLFQTSGDGSAHVDVVALIAGESVSVSKNLGTKYSFSLLQSDGVTVRVQDVSVSVDGGTPVLASYLDGTLTYQDRNPAGLTPTLDYDYTANTFDQWTSGQWDCHIVARERPARLSHPQRHYEHRCVPGQ